MAEITMKMGATTFIFVVLAFLAALASANSKR